MGGVTTANEGIEGRWGERSPSVYPHQLTFLSQRSLACELALYLVLVVRSHARASRQRRRECVWEGGGEGGKIRESFPFPLPLTASSLSCALSRDSLCSLRYLLAGSE